MNWEFVEGGCQGLTMHMKQAGIYQVGMRKIKTNTIQSVSQCAPSEIQTRHHTANLKHLVLESTYSGFLL
jgi:hypothetical protein